MLESTKLRFLVARSFNIGKAAAFYVAHRKWRESFVPQATGHISEEELPTFKDSDFGGFQYLPGLTPLLILKPRHHSPEIRSVDEMASECGDKGRGGWLGAHTRGMLVWLVGCMGGCVLGGCIVHGSATVDGLLKVKRSGREELMEREGS